MEIITNRQRDEMFGKKFEAALIVPSRIRIAVAFFTSADVIERAADSEEHSVHLIVSLNPPTSYEALRSVLSRVNVRVEFVASGLHSKIYIVDSVDGSRFAAIGSSNLTSGGLSGNIETNVLLCGDEVAQFNLESHFEFISTMAEPLSPEVLERYRETYESYKRNNPPTARGKLQSRPQRLKSAAAKEFIQFWKAVYCVHELVDDLARKHFPELPVYAAIDHFWHFVVNVTGEDATAREIEQYGRNEAVRRMFTEYAEWDNEGEQYWRVLAQKIELLQALLNESVIQNLTMSQARDVYAALHSSEMPIQRFGRDKDFVNDNSIEQVIETFSVLLHGEQRIEFRIDAVLSKHKLKHFGPSGVQELNGWYHPSRFPVRNSLAEKALQVLQIEPLQ
ncbi:MAG: phospholipase D family protein [Pirellulaceae bacterium]